VSQVATADTTAPLRTGAGGEAAAGSDAAERGTTAIQPRVVERIAAEAAREVDHTAGNRKSLLGVPVGSSDVPKASAKVDGPMATVDVSMAVHYPGRVREVADEVRHHVMSRVGELTGLDVPQVDVDVTALVADVPSRVR
jgi:uncharacterized alkaline shock family protein YloU